MGTALNGQNVSQVLLSVSVKRILLSKKILHYFIFIHAFYASLHRSCKYASFHTPY